MMSEWDHMMSEWDHMMSEWDHMMSGWDGSYEACGGGVEVSGWSGPDGATWRTIPSVTPPSPVAHSCRLSARPVTVEHSHYASFA